MLHSINHLLVFSAHPDDETCGAGGTIVKLSKLGKTIDWCVVTRGYNPDYSNEIIEEKKQEVFRVAKVLGISKIHFLDYPTTKLDTISFHELADRFTSLIQSVNPDTLFIPFKADMHQDHRKVFETVMISAKPIPDQPVKTILCYEVPSSTDYAPKFSESTFMPNFYVDVTSELDKKIEALKCFKTEMKKFPHSRSIEGIKAKTKSRGVEVGVPMAEAFVIIRTLSQ